MRNPHCSSAEPRYIIECINELLKNKANLVHLRHRSVHNSLMNLCAALAACCFFENKPEALPVRIEKSVSVQYSPFFFRYVLFPTFVQKNMFALNETNVYRVCCTPVDMRQGILRLCQFVRGNDFNPSDGCVYVFYNRPRNRIKLLHWERCGFVVYHKQMAQGCLSGKIMQQAAGFYELRWDELVLYMEGINPRCYRRKRYNKP